MPGYDIGPMKQMRQAMPDPIEKVLDFLFPVDADVVGSIAPAGMAVGPSKGLLQALKPALSPQSLGQSQDLAEVLAGRMNEYAPSMPTTVGPNNHAKRLIAFLEKAKPEPVDPNKIAAMSKVTGSRPPTKGSISIPEEFYIRGSRGVGKMDPSVFAKRAGSRDPNVDRLAKIWHDYETSQAGRYGNRLTGASKMNRPPLSSTTNERPPLSGKWSRNKTIGQSKNNKKVLQEGLKDGKSSNK